jgi:hypothetical protein
MNFVAIFLVFISLNLQSCEPFESSTFENMIVEQPIVLSDKFTGSPIRIFESVANINWAKTDSQKLKAYIAPIGILIVPDEIGKDTNLLITAMN